MFILSFSIWNIKILFEDARAKGEKSQVSFESGTNDYDGLAKSNQNCTALHFFNVWAKRTSSRRERKIIRAVRAEYVSAGDKGRAVGAFLAFYQTRANSTRTNQRFKATMNHVVP